MEFYYTQISFLYRTELVSIPNGMEFYHISKSYGVEKIAFQFPTGWNSTLRFYASWCLSLVSIPNGMKFYVKMRFLTDGLCAVSIPNGMEFYPTQLDQILANEARFNSQRDGILQMKFKDDG